MTNQNVQTKKKGLRKNVKGQQPFWRIQKGGGDKYIYKITD